MLIENVAVDLKDPAVSEALTQQLAERGEISTQYRHVRKDGSVYPFEFKCTLVPGSDHRLVVLGNDVSERLAQEQALRASEERMQLALQASNSGLFASTCMKARPNSR